MQRSQDSVTLTTTAVQHLGSNAICFDHHQLLIFVCDLPNLKLLGINYICGKLTIIQEQCSPSTSWSMSVIFVTPSMVYMVRTPWGKLTLSDRDLVRSARSASRDLNLS